jgi:hypothetical protein
MATKIVYRPLDIANYQASRYSVILNVETKGSEPDLLPYLDSAISNAKQCISRLNQRI